MPSNAQDVYTEIIRTLPPIERLRLATLILNDLVQQNPSGIDQSDYWTEQDQKDVVSFSLQYAAALFPDEEAI